MLGDPWAIGYAVAVVRGCPNWRMAPQSVLAARGVLPRFDPGSDGLAMGEAFQQTFYQGQADADRDRRADPRFCVHVPRLAGALWPRLARVLIRERS